MGDCEHSKRRESSNPPNRRPTSQMEDTMEVDLLSQILALSSEKKTTLSDVFRGFFLFLRDRNKDITKEIDTILTNFNPKTNVEKMFKAKLIDKYRVSEEVLNMLLSDDSLFITQASKCKWFFANIEDPTDFVVKIIPALSLSTRTKVVNKFAACLENTKAGEILYQSMKSRYGTKSVIPLLAVCGEDFLRSELPNVIITIPPRVSLALYNKYPSLMTEHLEYLAGNKSKTNHCNRLVDYENVFTKLSSRDLKSFLDFFEKHGNEVPYMKFGRRTTKRMIKNETNKVLDNYSKYSRFLVDKTFFHRLSYEQFKRIYISSILPSTVEDCIRGDRAVRVNLKHVKPALRSDLLLTTFKTKYLKEMTSEDILFNVDSVWIEYLPEEARIKWLEKRIADSYDVLEEQAGYISKLPVALSMPRLKKLIESQSDATMRQTIGRLMVTTLAINNCSSGIKDLVAYFVKRFRNEVSKFRENIVKGMATLEDLFLSLSLEDWAPINDFINIMKLNGEIQSSSKYNLRCIYSYQIQTSFTQDKNVAVVLANYLEMELSDKKDLEVGVINILEKSPFHKKFLVWLIGKVPELDWKRDDSKLSFTACLSESMCTYCLENDDKFEFPKWMVDIWESVLASEQRYPIISRNGKVIEYLRIHPIPNLEKYTVKKEFPEIMSCDLLCHLLMREPNVILSHVRVMMEKALLESYDNYQSFYKKCRMFDTFEFPDEMIKMCRVALKLHEPEYDLDSKNPLSWAASQPHAVRILALLLPSSEYLNMVEPFIPTGKKIEEYTQEIRDVYDLQQGICKSFVNVDTPSAALPVLRRFAGGDYLKLVVGALVGTCVKVPENKVLPLLEQWMNCPVSLRKHILRLTYKIAPTEYSVQRFVNIFKTEKNISLRLVLFLLFRKSLLDEPGDDTFNIFTSIISQLNVEDEEALKNLFLLSNMEPAYVSRYLELLWYLVETKWGTVLPKGKENIMEMITNNNLPLLSEEFCDTVMSYEFSNKLPLSSPAAFLRRYLLHAPSYESQTRRLNKIMSVLKPLIKNHWDDYSFAPCKLFRARYIITDIVDNLCSSSVLTSPECFPVSSVQILADVKNALSSLIKPEHFLQISVPLDMAIIHRSDFESDQLVTAVAQLCNAYITKYGNLYGPPLIECLTSFAVNYKEANDVALELITKNYDHPFCQLLGVHILVAKGGTFHAEKAEQYSNLIERLSSSEHPSVQVAANQLFTILANRVI